jgi:predicted metal-dependent hydrolase
VPPGCTPEEIAGRMRKRAIWINRQREYFSRFVPRTPPRRYLGGETHLYLGRRYRLKLVPGEKSSVALQRGILVVSSPEKLSPMQVKTMLAAWYRRRAVRVYNEVLDDYFALFARRGHERPDIVVRAMDRRWGSLSPRRLMTLNRQLIRAPRSCIEYVVMHELCHLEHKHHGVAFYRLLIRAMPDWQARKYQLEKVLL